MPTFQYDKHALHYVFVVVSWLFSFSVSMRSSLLDDIFLVQEMPARAIDDACVPI